MRSPDRSAFRKPDGTRQRSGVSNAVRALDGVLAGLLALGMSRFAAAPAAAHDVMIAGFGAALLIVGRARRRWEYAEPFLRNPAIQCRAVAAAVMIGTAATFTALMLMSWPPARALFFAAAWLVGGTVVLGLGRLAIALPTPRRTSDERRPAA